MCDPQWKVVSLPKPAGRFNVFYGDERRYRKMMVRVIVCSICRCTDKHFQNDRPSRSLTTCARCDRSFCSACYYEYFSCHLDMMCKDCKFVGLRTKSAKIRSAKR